MQMEPTYLVDTNILLRLSKRDDPWHAVVQAALDALAEKGSGICCTPQNVTQTSRLCFRKAFAHESQIALGDDRRPK